MSEKIKSLLDSARAGDSAAIGITLNAIMTEKISARMDDIKAEIGASLFKESAELTLEDFALEELESFLVSEEYEQLDEVSKETLMSYINKAAASKADAAYDQGGYAEKREMSTDKNRAARKLEKKRTTGIAKAVRKLAKESVDLNESKDKVHTVDIDHSGGDDPVAKKLKIKLVKTGDYSHNATGTKANLRKYLTHHYESEDDAKDMHPDVFNESVELTLEDFKEFVASNEYNKLDEVSKTTLQSYIKKASEDQDRTQGKATNASNHEYFNGKGSSGENIDVLRAKIQKRKAGIAKADSKLVKG